MIIPSISCRSSIFSSFYNANPNHIKPSALIPLQLAFKNNKFEIQVNYSIRLQSFLTFYLL